MVQVFSSRPIQPRFLSLGANSHATQQHHGFWRSDDKDHWSPSHGGSPTVLLGRAGNWRRERAVRLGSRHPGRPCTTSRQSASRIRRGAIERRWYTLGVLLPLSRPLKAFANPGWPLGNTSTKPLAGAPKAPAVCRALIVVSRVVEKKGHY